MLCCFRQGGGYYIGMKEIKEKQKNGFQKFLSVDSFFIIFLFTFNRRWLFKTDRRTKDQVKARYRNQRTNPSYRTVLRQWRDWSRWWGFFLKEVKWNKNISSSPTHNQSLFRQIEFIKSWSAPPDTVLSKKKFVQSWDLKFRISLVRSGAQMDKVRLQAPGDFLVIPHSGSCVATCESLFSKKK